MADVVLKRHCKLLSFFLQLYIIYMHVFWVVNTYIRLIHMDDWFELHIGENCKLLNQLLYDWIWAQFHGDNGWRHICIFIMCEQVWVRPCVGNTDDRLCRLSRILPSCLPVCHFLCLSFSVWLCVLSYLGFCNSSPPNPHRLRTVVAPRCLY